MATKRKYDSTGMNANRAEWAGTALAVFAATTGLDTAGEDDATAVGDLLGDLMHYCKQNKIDFDARLANGRMHFEAEYEDAEAA